MNKRENPEPGLPTGVGLTALNVARARAVESRRVDRLFDDPWAQAFVTAAGSIEAQSPEPMALPTAAGAPIQLASMLDEYVPIRTRFFDDCLRDACAADCRQVALVAAGLDTRAFRLAWPPGVRLFELDLPEVFRFKEGVLSAHHATPACLRTVVPVDLRADWPAALVGAGFRPTEATAWLLEGILMYLGERERDQLVERLSDLSRAGSRLALEPPGWTIPASLIPALALGRIDPADLTQLKSLTDAAQADASVADPMGWLASHGWTTRLYSAKTQFAAYGRTVPPAVEALLGATPRWLATAERS